MGYTQSWHQHRDFTDQEWAILMKCADWVIAQATRRGIVLCGGDGTGVPIVSTARIIFNGDSGTGNDYETFLLDKSRPARSDWVSQEEYESEGAYEFCKTAQEPYDSAVVAMLVIAKKVAPGALDLRSDGGDAVFDRKIDIAVQKIIARGTAGKIKLPEPLTEYTARFALMDLD